MVKGYGFSMATAKCAINLAFVNLAFAIQKTLDNIQKNPKPVSGGTNQKPI